MRKTDLLQEQDHWRKELKRARKANDEQGLRRAEEELAWLDKELSDLQR